MTEKGKGDTCGGCRFFRAYEYHSEDHDAGESEGSCRRYPPVRYQETEFERSCSIWPTVWVGAWCGEHEAVEP